VFGKIGISTERLVELVTHAPRKIFALPDHSIKKDSTADLTLFVPGIKYKFDEKHIRSKSKNSAFVGEELVGKVIGIINGEKLFLNP